MAFSGAQKREYQRKYMQSRRLRARGIKELDPVIKTDIVRPIKLDLVRPEYPPCPAGMGLSQWHYICDKKFQRRPD